MKSGRATRATAPNGMSTDFTYANVAGDFRRDAVSAVMDAVTKFLVPPYFHIRHSNHQVIRSSNVVKFSARLTEDGKSSYRNFHE